MANLLHTKGSRNQIRTSFPVNNMGSDGDIIFSSIKGQGTYLCSKINGRWFVSNKLQDLKRGGLLKLFWKKILIILIFKREKSFI